MCLALENVNTVHFVNVVSFISQQYTQQYNVYLYSVNAPTP